MARPRMQLHELLLTFVPNVYFQPPANVQMKYPCIVYNVDSLDSKFADNGPYLHTKRYLVTGIDPDPDSAIFDLISALPLCSFSQRFVVDNLYHSAFSLFF